MGDLGLFWSIGALFDTYADLRFDVRQQDVRGVDLLIAVFTGFLPLFIHFVL